MTIRFGCLFVSRVLYLGLPCMAMAIVPTWLAGGAAPPGWPSGLLDKCCLTAEAICCRIIDQAYRDWSREGPPVKGIPLTLASELSSTPAGQRQLRAMLEDTDPRKAASAASFLWYSRDMDVVLALRRCVERNRSNREVTVEACVALDNFLQGGGDLLGIGVLAMTVRESRTQPRVGNGMGEHAAGSIRTSPSGKERRMRNTGAHGSSRL